MSEHPFHRRTRHSTRVRAGRSLPLLFLTLLILLLAGCDTAQAPPASDPDETPNETPSETPREEPAPGEPTRGEPFDELNVTLERIAPDTGFDQALGVVTDGDSDRLYVMQQEGLVAVVDDGELVDDDYLDLTGSIPGEAEVDAPYGGIGEAGLLGLAFAPDDPSVAFVYYTPLVDGVLYSRISRFEVGTDGTLDEGSESPLVEFTQPTPMHNGGQLAFGPDGMLYAAIGDGGTGGDPARDPGDPLGTILRLDPSAVDDEFVPADNPFPDAIEDGRYVWQFGLRNPWRFSFDAPTGDLWLADVGEDAFEEINYLPAGTEGGLDFGWNAFEGPSCILEEGCDGIDHREPDYAYEHPPTGGGRSITGGYVYRGDAIPELVGAYVFGDYVAGTISAAWVEGGEFPMAPLVFDAPDGGGLSISSFGVDAAGELLVVDYADSAEGPGGGLYRIVPASDADTAE